jgi:hypothetical protein
MVSRSTRCRDRGGVTICFVGGEGAQVWSSTLSKIFSPLRNGRATASDGRCFAGAEHGSASNSPIPWRGHGLAANCSALRFLNLRRNRLRTTRREGQNRGLSKIAWRRSVRAFWTRHRVPIPRHRSLTLQPSVADAGKVVRSHFESRRAFSTGRKHRNGRKPLLALRRRV